MRKILLIALLGLFTAFQGLAVNNDLWLVQTEEASSHLIDEVLKEAAHCSGISETEVFAQYEKGKVQIEKIPGAYEVSLEREGGGVLQIIVDEGL